MKTPACIVQMRATGKHLFAANDATSFAALDASATAAAREAFFLQADLAYSQGSAVRDAIRYTDAISAQINRTDDLTRACMGELHG